MQADRRTRFLGFHVVCFFVAVVATGLFSNLAFGEGSDQVATSNGDSPVVGEATPSPVTSPSPAIEAGPVLKAPGRIVVGIVSVEPQTEFEAKTSLFFKGQWSQCGNCDLRNLSVYDQTGKFDEKATLQNLPAASQGLSILFLNVNWRFRADQHAQLVESLKKIVGSRTLVVGSSGYPKEGESSAPLTRTVLGQIQDVIIIGEINERERLLTTSFFGPEMLTAIRPPRDYIGKGLGPSYFVAKLALNFNRRVPLDWMTHFRNQKLKTRRIWPQVEEFFPR